MIQPVCLHEKTEIERFLRGNVYLHIYSLGDLDDFFWPYTVWFASRTEAALDAIALLYVGQPLPTLLALSEQADCMRGLLGSVQHLLPSRFYAHLSPGIESVFSGGYDVDPRGEHYKMALQRPAAAIAFDSAGVVPLGKDHLDEILEFYQRSYPGNWFDPRMLETGQFFGLREQGGLASIAGVHVYSPGYGVAALGNVATLPGSRGRGYAKRVTARLCQSLLSSVEHVGANVKADNHAALACYRQLGFDVVASYEEFMITRR